MTVRMRVHSHSRTLRARRRYLILGVLQLLLTVGLFWSFSLPVFEGRSWLAFLLGFVAFCGLPYALASFLEWRSNQGFIFRVWDNPGYHKVFKVVFEGE